MKYPEAEFLDIIGTKVLRVFLLAIHCHLYSRILPSPLEQKWFETGCNVNIVYGNLKSENSQDNVQKTSTKLYVYEFGFSSLSSLLL
jgi:hypothetical protein